MSEPTKTEDYFKPENAQSSEEHFSSTKKYKLVVTVYSTKQDCWNYTRGEVYRVSTNKLIADIGRNYSVFMYSFQIKDNQEYLITGRSYMGQTIVNLDAEWEVSTSKPYQGAEFCWVAHYLSLDGLTLAVAGCHWACPYEIKFFDFSNPRVLPLPEFEHRAIYYDKTYGWSEKGFKCSCGYEVFIPWNKSEDDLTLEELEQIGKEFGDEDDDKLWKYVDSEIWIFHREGDEMVGKKFDSLYNN